MAKPKLSELQLPIIDEAVLMVKNLNQDKTVDAEMRANYILERLKELNGNE